MTAHRDPNWIYWFPFAGLMAAFTTFAVGFALGESWLYLAIGVFGILTSALAWRTTQSLRAQIQAQKRLHVDDTYKIAALEADLRRARAWNN